MATNIYFKIKKFDEDNIVYIKPIHFPKICRNMAIYYRDNPENKKQKIIIKFPKMILPFAPKEFINNGKKNYKAMLSFSTMTNLYNEEEIRDYFNFVTKIDKINEETVMSYKKKWGLSKNIEYRKSYRRQTEDYPFSMDVCLPYDDTYGFLFDIYDENAKKGDINTIGKRCIVSTVVELTDMWFSDKEFGCNWNVLQMRKFKPYSPIQEFFHTACFIEDEDDPEDKVYSQMIEAYRQKLSTQITYPHFSHHQNFAPPPQTSYTSSFAPPPPPPPSMSNPTGPAFVPTEDQLANAMAGLKKTKLNKKTVKVIDGKVVDKNEDVNNNDSNEDVKKKKNTDNIKKKDKKKDDDDVKKKDIKKDDVKKNDDVKKKKNKSSDSEPEEPRELLKTPKKDLIGLKKKKI